MYEEQLHRLQGKLFVLQYISAQDKSCFNTSIMFSVHLRDWALNELDMQRYTHVLKVVRLKTGTHHWENKLLKQIFKKADCKYT